VQAALLRGGEPELQFGGADGDGVAAAEDFVLDGSAIDGDKGVCGGCEFEAFFFLEF